MKTTAILFFFILILQMNFISCDNDNNDYPVRIATPVPTPTPTPTPTPVTIERQWYYYTISKTIDGVTSPEANFSDDPICGGFDSILISNAGTVSTTIHYPYVNYFSGCTIVESVEGNWSLSEGRYEIPIVAGYKINEGKMEMLTDFFELVSVSSEMLKVKSYPKTEGGKTTVTNITFTIYSPYDY